MSIRGSSWLKLGLFAVGLGQSFVFVLIPPLARDLGLSEIQSSSIFAISAIAWALTSAMWGRASDKYGRKYIVITGLIGNSLSLICLISPLILAEKNLINVTLLFPLLIFGRLLNGLIGSATRPASFAYIADTSTPEQRTVKFARLESSFLIGTVAGPLIGGFLFIISKETPFFIFAAIGFLVSFGIYYNLKEVKPSLPVKTQKSSIPWYSETIWPFLFITALNSLCLASLLQSIGFFITDKFVNLDNTPIVISMTFTLLSLSTVFSQYFFTDYIKLNTYNMLIYGCFLIFISFFFIAYFSLIYLFFLSIIIYGIGSGMLRPAIASSLSLAQNPDNQGAAAGYLGTVLPIGHMLTPILTIPIYMINPSYLYYFCSLLCIISLVFIMKLSIFKENAKI